MVKHIQDVCTVTTIGFKVFPGLVHVQTAQCIILAVLLTQCIIPHDNQTHTTT